MKKYIFLLLILLLSGCHKLPEHNIGGGVVNKEFELAGEKVIVGGERLLGGAEETAFKPEVKLEKWGDETFLKVWSEETGDKTATQIGDKVVWNNTDKSKEFQFYTLSATTDMEDGGFEYNIVLKQKPTTNIIQLKIETQDLRFFYQPVLAEQEIAEGAFRPENVIGSYAVYHSTKQGDYSQMGGKNYKVGKAFHIYRPQIIDAKGNKVWGELNIKDGILSITINEKFLETAVYPVLVDPTFGYTSIGATVSAWSGGDDLVGVKVTSSENGTVTKISAAIYAVSGTISAKTAIYLDSDNSLVANSASNEVTGINTTKQFTDFATAGNPTVSATNYLLAGWSSTDCYYAVDNTGGSGYEKMTTAYGSFPSTLTINSSNSAANFSIYATYTASGGGETAFSTSTKSAIINSNTILKGNVIFK